jgi:hypothetical protein
MVAVPVSYQNMGRALDGGGAVRRIEHRVAVQPGVEQQHLIADFDAERGVAEPGDFHGRSPLGCIC